MKLKTSQGLKEKRFQAECNESYFFGLFVFVHGFGCWEMDFVFEEPQLLIDGFLQKIGEGDFFISVPTEPGVSPEKVFLPWQEPFSAYPLEY